MTPEAGQPCVSILMPTFRQAHFIGRAVASALAQDLSEPFEIIVIDDGSPDDTAAVVESLGADPRLRYHRLERNGGLGAALNVGLDLASAPLIGYLPTDDVWFDDHLASLVALLDERPDAVLAYSGVRREERVPGKGVIGARTSAGQIDGLALQLVQVVHRATEQRWVERAELVTDDLDRMFWDRLRPEGEFAGTGRVTCEWVDHPLQRHKIVREPLGGPNPYRRYYGVAEPLRYSTTAGNRIDEVENYRRFRERPPTPVADDGLKILLVGELAFNSERILALEERGHRLYGLWTPDGHWFNTVGPVPFGHVEDLPAQGWREAVERLRPDVIYGLLNWEAVPFAHEVLTAVPDVPFVWHFKESPFDCIANGTWPLLVDLFTHSDGQVYTSPEMLDWFTLAVPSIGTGGNVLVLDGDLPKRDWFDAERSPLLSAADGEIHTVVPGGPIGLVPPLVGRLAEHGIHLHFYGDFHRGQWLGWVEQVQRAAPDHFHLHPQVNHPDWVRELSQYDAGWLHQIRSTNGGDLRRAVWGDLNYPARIATLAVSGVPLIQMDNTDAVVATQSLTQRLDLGLAYSDPDELAAQLHDASRMEKLRDSLWRQRDEFMFDTHADALLDVLRRAIERGSQRVLRHSASP